MEQALLTYGDGPRAIYELLKKQIVSGQLEAGTELKIMPLAAEMGVSTVPVREAVRILAAEGLVVLRPRRSPVIAKLDQRDLVEINRIRGMLEPFVLEDAIAGHTDATLADCEAILEQDLNCEDLWEKAELNKQFHMTLLAPSSFKRTLAIIGDQYVGMARIIHYRLVHYLAHDPELVGRHHGEHEAIFRAVGAGDNALAVDLMTRHIERATKRAQDLFDKPRTEPESAR